MQTGTFGASGSLDAKAGDADAEEDACADETDGAKAVCFWDQLEDEAACESRFDPAHDARDRFGRLDEFERCKDETQYEEQQGDDEHSDFLPCDSNYGSCRRANDSSWKDLSGES